MAGCNRTTISYEDAKQVDIEHALEFVPSDDRDTWLKMAMALKSEIGDDAFSIWDHWSSTAHNYNERDARSVWRSIRGSGVGIGSLFYEAQQNGYRKDADYKPKPIPKKPPPKPQSSTGDYALKLWANRDEMPVEGHPYARAEHIDWEAGAGRGMASGKVVGKYADCIIIPVRNLSTDTVQAVQCINPGGKKQTLGSLAGGAFICGNTLDTSLRWFIVEGWADAISIVFHHYQGNAAAFAACGKGRMETLKADIHRAYGVRAFIVEDME